MTHETTVRFPAASTSGPAAFAALRGRRIPWLFVIVVVIPVLVAAIYYLLIASPLYVSEADFVVHEKNESQGSGLGNVLQSMGMSEGGASEMDAYEVQGYLESHDAVAAMAANHQLRSILNRPEGDFLSKFPRPFESTSFEGLYKSYRRFITVGFDPTTGLSKLRVKAYRPEDSRALAEGLMESAEDLVNRMNQRALADALTVSEKQVSDAEAKVVAAQGTLTAYRNHAGLIDPDKSSENGLELLSKLETQAAFLRAERAGMAASSPQSPQLPVEDRRIAAFDSQLATEQARLAGQHEALAPQVAEYEHLKLEEDLAAKSLEAALAGYESAAVNARRQQLFLERVSGPNFSDNATEPRRWLTLLIISVSALVAYAIISLVMAGVREHRQV